MDQNATPLEAQSVILAGQEALVRRMVAPALPAGWGFLGATVVGAEIRARYAHPGPPSVEAELHLAPGPGPGGDGPAAGFSLTLLAPAEAPAPDLLRGALEDSVRAEQSALRWAHVTAAQPPAGATPAPALHDPAVPTPRTRGAVREAQAAFARGAFDEALETLRAFAQDGAAPADVAGTLGLRVEMMWSLGRYCEALEALDAALATFPGSVALHTLAATRRASLHDKRAATHARALAERADATVGLRLQGAQLLLRLGHEGEARRATDRALAATPNASASLLLDVAALYWGAGDYNAAALLYDQVLALDPAHAAARVAAGTLLAWRGDARAARAHADAVLAADPASAPALCLRGATRLLAGEDAEALADLDRAAEIDPSDGVAALWRGEALIRFGKFTEALEEVRRGGELSADMTNHVAAQILASLAQVGAGVFPGMPEYVLGPALDALEADAVAPPGGAARPAGPGLHGRLEACLGKLRGNRSPVATYVRRDGALVRLKVPPSPRVAAKEALWRFVATGDPGATLQELDRIHAAAPGAAEPYNYRGELFLYLGDAATARREFERAISLYGQSRWAYIGLAGAAVIEGRPEEALAHLAQGIVLAGAPGPTAYAYRGEALRLLGRLEGARADLEHAVRRHPSRVGAWVNLALIDMAEGRLDELQEILTLLHRRAPGLFTDAAAALGVSPAEAAEPVAASALLAEMLVMLRGNRGASCVTYFTRDGRLRTVPPSHL